MKLNLEKSIAEIKARRIFKNVSYDVEEGSKNNLKIINISVEERLLERLVQGQVSAQVVELLVLV